MKRILIALALSVVASMFTVSAQLLWRIEGNGLTKPSYIFGTHHVAPASVIGKWGVEKIAGSVDKVVGELDMIHGAADEAAYAMARLSAAPADSTLSVVLGTADMGRLGRLMSELAGMEIAADQFDGVKPAVVSAWLAMMQSVKAFPDYDHQTQLDALVLGMAERAGVETLGLETPEFQANLLMGQPISMQAAELKRMLDNSELSYAKARELADAYLAGDLDAMWAIVNDPVIGATPDEVDRMITSRNADWLKILCAMIPTASVLVVVGAGHLPGTGGLIEMLRRRGYTVTPENPEV